MNKFVKLLITALAAVIGLSFTACGDGSGDNGGGNGTDTPIASFVGTWNASGGRSIVFSGSNFTYKVNGTPEYAGTFSVSGSKITFKETMQFGGQSASGNFTLSGTTLTLSNHTWDSSVNGTYTKDSGGGGGGGNTGTYIITGSGTIFTATKNGATVGTANQAIQTVIDAIKTDANGANCTIQFGSGGSNVLDIGTAGISFISTMSSWGTITLTGKITSARTNGAIGSNANIVSTADITNTAGSAIQNGGTLTINGGTILTTGKNGVITIDSDRVLTINGGTVRATESSSRAVENGGTLTITGGTIEVTGANSRAIYNYGRGNTTITNGTISATGNNSNAIVHDSDGTATITTPPTVIDKTKTSGTITWLPPLL